MYNKYDKYYKDCFKWLFWELALYFIATILLFVIRWIPFSADTMLGDEGYPINIGFFAFCGAPIIIVSIVAEHLPKYNVKRNVPKSLEYDILIEYNEYKKNIKPYAVTMEVILGVVGWLIVFFFWQYSLIFEKIMGYYFPLWGI